MANSSSGNVGGITPITQKGMIGSTPAQSAFLENQNKAALQTQANALAGGKKRKYYGGNIPVGQFNVGYSEQVGEGGVNDQVKQGAQIGSQSYANAKFDSLATKMGGSKKYKSKNSKSRNNRTKSKKGGNPDWSWGCLSGGKKYKKRSTKKHRKSKQRR
jgi:hypothetical protein